MVSVIATGFEGFELLARRPQQLRQRSRRRGDELALGDRDRRDLEVAEDEIDVPPFLRGA